MNLYQYKKTLIQSGIHDFLDLFEDPDISWIEQAQIAAEMKFRDRAGRYWYADIYENEWHFYKDGKWLVSSEVPDVLEGVIPLFPGEAELPEILEEDQDSETESGGQSPKKVLENSLRKIRVDYQDGNLSSDGALRISQRHYLIDDQGRIWTVGLQTGDWYQMENDGWTKAQEPPADDQLIKLQREDQCSSCGQSLEGSLICPQCGHENPPEFPDLSDEAYGRILDFFLQDKPFPENITEPWHPPEGYPESMKDHFIRPGSKGIYCPQCGQLQESHGNFCAECGSKLN